MLHRHRKLLGGLAVAVAALAVAAVALAGTRATPPSTLVFYQWSDPDTLDPANAHGTSITGRIVQNVYDRLVRMSADGRKVEPSLATSWTVSKDGLTYTFKLRKGVKFHDGSPFNAQAVRYSIQRAMKIGESVSVMYKDFLLPQNIRALNASTVQFKLSKPYSEFLSLLAYYAGGSIVSPSWVRAHATKDDPYAMKYVVDHANGTGPFKLTTWSRKQFIQLDRNPSYWRGKAKLSKIIFKTISDPTAARLQFERGDLDVISNIPTDTYNALAKNPKVTVKAYPGLDSVYWVFNNSVEPFDDARVRRAISYAVNYQEILGLVGVGGSRMTSPIPPSMKEYNPKVTRYNRDLTKAKQLLSQAGYPNGLTIETTVVDYGELKPISQILQANLADAGITLKIKEQPYGLFIDDITSGRAAMYPWVSGPAIADADAIVYPQFLSTSPPTSDGNYTRYKNAKVDALLKTAHNSLNEAVRLKAFQQAQALIVADAPWVLLFNRNGLQSYQKNVTGYYWPAVGAPDLWGVGKS